jgi:hypothetical protein
MKYLRFEIDVNLLARELAEKHKLPAGQWCKPALDKTRLTLTFGSEEIAHPFSFAMTLQEWKDYQAEQDRKAAAKQAEAEALEAKRRETAETKVKARKQARGVKHHAEEAQGTTGETGGE